MKKLSAASLAFMTALALDVTIAGASASQHLFGSSSWTTSEDVSTPSQSDRASLMDMFFEVIGFDQNLKMQNANHAPFALNGVDAKTVQPCDDEKDQKAVDALYGGEKSEEETSSATTSVTGPEPLFFAF